jgi:hypothetical protein
MLPLPRDRRGLQRALACLTLAVVTGCATPPLPEPSAARRIEAQCPPLSDATHLAASSLKNNLGDEYLRESYGELLRKASAPRLWCGQGPIEAYRLLLLPSYGPALIVMAVRTDDGWMLQGIEFTTKDPTPWSGWVVERHVEKHIPTELMAPMFGALQRGAFWTTDVDSQQPRDGDDDCERHRDADRYSERRALGRGGRRLQWRRCQRRRRRRRV